MASEDQAAQPDGGDHSGGGEQGERIEGSLTDGGSLPGYAHQNDPRSFGAGRTAAEGEGGGSMSGRAQEHPGEPRAGEALQVAGETSPEGRAVSEGVATSLQPGGIIPGGGPGATQGSLGTGGGSTGGADTGAVKRDGI